MGSSAGNIAAEIVWIRGKSGSKQDLVSGFRKMYDLSTEVAIESQSEPALGLKPYDTIQGHPDDVCMFLYWNSVEQHDALSASPKFEAGCSKLMTDEVLPKLREPIESFYVHSGSNDLVLSDAYCVESESFELYSGYLVQSLSLSCSHRGPILKPRYRRSAREAC